MTTIFNSPLVWTVAFLILGQDEPPALAQPATPNRMSVEEGLDLLSKLIEANRYWLIAPPEEITEYSYAFHLYNSEPTRIAVKRPKRASHARRQGATYYSPLHALAQRPDRAVVREATRIGNAVTLSLAFDPSVKFLYGNGIENSWRGYFSVRGNYAQITVDAERLLPLKSVFDGVEESFSDFARANGNQYVPLSIQVKKDGELRFDWRFRLYEPGLWLLDFGRSGSERLAWIEEVQINGKQAPLQEATTVSLERQQARQAGHRAIQRVLEANQNWLLPSLESRQNLAYEYLQEPPYRERALFGPDGDILVELTASEQSPERTTRQRMWTNDGFRIDADYDAPFVSVSKAGDNATDGGGVELDWMQDRAVRNLAFGLGFDCALTRLAREPESFWAETLPIDDSPDRYLLVLHPKKDARLFTGTMLMFTSWAYMHDVDYARSEIVCDTASHRALEERDYDRDGNLKARYRFENYLEDGLGVAPGHIRAVMPYEKEKRDQSLEMLARFRFAKPGVWLLERVESSFRGGGGSTGVLKVIDAEDADFNAITVLRERARRTLAVLEAIESSAEGDVETDLIADGEWRAIALRPAWSESAADSVKTPDESQSAIPSLIGLHRARAGLLADGGLEIELEGVSSISWKEFETHWKVTITGAQSEPVERSAVVDARCERAPAPFHIRLEFPSGSLPATTQDLRIGIQGRIERMSGMYHGHGMWMRLSKHF